MAEGDDDTAESAQYTPYVSFLEGELKQWMALTDTFIRRTSHIRIQGRVSGDKAAFDVACQLEQQTLDRSNSKVRSYTLPPKADTNSTQRRSTICTGRQGLWR